MNLEALETFFMWTTLIHLLIMILWIFLLKFASKWFRHQQGRWFPLPEETFMPLHYLMYGMYKLMVLVFSAIPYIALILLDK